MDKQSQKTTFNISNTFMALDTAELRAVMSRAFTSLVDAIGSILETVYFLGVKLACPYKDLLTPRRRQHWTEPRLLPNPPQVSDLEIALARQINVVIS